MLIAILVHIPNVKESFKISFIKDSSKCRGTDIQSRIQYFPHPTICVAFSKTIFEKP